MTYWFIETNTETVNPWQLKHIKYPHNINTFDEVQLFPPVVQSVQGIIHSGNPGSVKELFILTLSHWRPACQFVCVYQSELKSEHMEEDNNSNGNQVKSRGILWCMCTSKFPWRQLREMINTLSRLDSALTFKINAMKTLVLPCKMVISHIEISYIN